MRKLDGEQVLMRIFVGESDRWEHRPLHIALVELFRREGLAGATVLRAVAGFGADSVVHTADARRTHHPGEGARAEVRGAYSYDERGRSPPL